MGNVAFYAIFLLIFAISACKKEEQSSGTPAHNVTVTRPVVTSTTPIGPANNNSPMVNGTAQKLVLIKLYSDSACTTQIGIGNSIEDGTFSVQATVQDNVTTSIYAKAFNGAYESSCSTTFATYIETSTPTANQVAFISTTPASPSESLTTRILGQSVPNSTIELYTTNDCSGAPAYTGSVSALGVFEIDVAVNPLSTTTFKGISILPGLTSLCSTASIVYQNVDTTPPERPVVVAINPTGPSTLQYPTISGTGDPGTTVTFFRNSTCTTQVGIRTPGTNTIDSNGDFSLDLNISANVNWNIYARSTDASGNNSPCSTTYVNYIRDNTAPAEPQFADTTPISPSNSQTPFINGLTEADATVELFTTEDCSGASAGSAQANASGAFAVQTSVGINSINKFYGRATDIAGNVGACSANYITYVHQADLTLPIMPVFHSITPEGPSDHNSPEIEGEAEAFATVNIYNAPDCSGATVGTGVADINGQFNIAVASADNMTTTYYGRAENALGDQSPCTPASISYTTYSIPEGVGWFTNSTMTTTNGTNSSTNLNQTTLRSLMWGLSEYHSTYYEHSRTTNSHQVRVNVSGNYLVALNIPYSVNGSNIAIRADVRVNGVNVNVGRSVSGYLSNNGSHRNASIHLLTMLNLNANDVIDVTVFRASGGTTSTPVSESASLMMEFLDAGRNIFFATGTQTIDSSNVNQSIAHPIEWTHSEQGAAFAHNNGVDSQNIELSSGGHYLAAINVPLELGDDGDPLTESPVNVKLIVKLNGVMVPHGIASHGYINGATHTTSSLHWFGAIPSVTAGDVLTVETVGVAGEEIVTIPVATNRATIFLERVSSTGLFIARGDALTGGANWNVTPGEAVVWSTADALDGAYYSHAGGSGVTLNTQGDYFLMFNAPVISGDSNISFTNKIRVGGTPVSGSESKASYISNANGQNESSNALTFLLRNRSIGNVVDMLSTLNSGAGTATSAADACLILQHKPNSLTP